MVRTWSSLLASILVAAMPARAAPAYQPAGTIALGAPDRWDYALFDPADGRLYVAHGDRLTVVDGNKGALLGSVEGIAGGTHGIVISHATGQGFTDDGRAGVAVAFDLKTLKPLRRIPAADDADAIAIEPQSGHIFVVDGEPGTLSVIDPRSDRLVATIGVGEKLEFAVADEGVVYVAGAGGNDLVRIDARTNRVTAHWPTPHCQNPHGLALDPHNRRLFMGCVNSMMAVVDADSGRVVAELPIGRGNDAIAFDPVRRRVFSSNGIDGTVTIYQQLSPDRYRPLDVVHTKVSGRTMAVDPKSGRSFVIAADTDPNPNPGGRPVPRPGTLAVLMFDPAG